MSFPAATSISGADPAPPLSLPAGSDHHELRTDHLLADIGRRSVRGGAMMFAAQAVKVLAQFGAVVILARLLPPAAFGLIAMTAALYAVLDPIRELGLSAATIQKSDITHAQVSTLFWINVGLGTLVAAGLFLAAPLVARFYGEPELVAVTHWIALGFLISGTGAQHWALLRRQMRFGSVAILESSAEVISFGVAIAAALAGAGYWALVIQRLVSPTLITAGCWTLCRWRPGRPSLVPGLGELLGYGGSLAGTTVIGIASRSIDQVLIGWFWGAGTLGLYERAAKLLMLPLNNIVIPLYSVGMPALSRLTADHERYRRVFGEILEKLAMMTVPAAAAIAATADWTTDILFGPQWSAAAPLVACFAAVAAYQPSMYVAGLLYMTQNRARELVRTSVIDAAISVMVILLTLRYGTTVMAEALAAAGLFIRIPIGYWLATVRGPVRLGQLYATMLPSALAGIAIVGAIWVLRHFVLPHDIHPILGLCAAVAAAAATAGAVFWSLPKSRQGLLGVLSAGKLLVGA